MNKLVTSALACLLAACTMTMEKVSDQLTVEHCLKLCATQQATQKDTTEPPASASCMPQ